ncbi:MAG: imidazolonepropionase [Dermabacter sp.]|nr:imidazolonepropionase [Dermabacter sp.]
MNEQCGEGPAGVLREAALVIQGQSVAWVGPASAAPDADARVDVEGRAVLPGWVDSHTHLLFDGDRSAEFEARMAGEAYAAGGIQVTTDATRRASDERLLRLLRERATAALRGGTTCLETKTGYGLTVADEARAARVAASAVDSVPGAIDEVTFLGAHLVPAEYRERPEQYVDLVCGPMLEAVRPYVRHIDVFCEDGAFTPEQSRRVLDAGRAAGLFLHVHGNQLGESGGVQLAVQLGAASVDHVNHLDDADIEALAAGPTVATILPACDISTRAPFAPARRLLDAGATVAIASNCNPGTSYTSDMNLCVATAVLQQHLSLAEALTAATRGGARALGRTDVGHLGVGARADLHVLDAPRAIHLAYRPGMPLTHAVWRAGTLAHRAA